MMLTDDLVYLLSFAMWEAVIWVLQTKLALTRGAR